MDKAIYSKTFSPYFKRHTPTINENVPDITLSTSLAFVSVITFGLLPFNKGHDKFLMNRTNAENIRVSTTPLHVHHNRSAITFLCR